MQSITQNFNARTADLNPAWLAIMWLYIGLDVQTQIKDDKRRMERAIQQNRQQFQRRPVAMRPS